jgi:hypothetical protein
VGEPLAIGDRLEAGETLWAVSLEVDLDEALCLLREVVELLKVHDAHVVCLWPHDAVHLQPPVARTMTYSPTSDPETGEARAIADPIGVQARR